MSFEEFVSSYSRTFGQTPIRFFRLSSPVSTYVGAPDQSYRRHYLLCQAHFTAKSISIAFYLHGTAYFEYLTEEKIRQRLQLLNNASRRAFDREQIQKIILRLKHMFTIEGMKEDRNQCHAKLLSARLLSIEIHQDDLKFKFRCDERSELFTQHCLRQLLIQVKELSRRQMYLCDLLEHKDQLTHFDAQSFLSTPLTFVEDDGGKHHRIHWIFYEWRKVLLEDEDEEEEIFSSSSTDRLLKSAFARRGIEQFLDVCLLQKAYMKTLESNMDEEEEISVVLDQMVDRICAMDEEDEDDLNLAKRLAKRALMNPGTGQIKRFRSIDME